MSFKIEKETYLNILEEEVKKLLLEKTYNSNELSKEFITAMGEAPAYSEPSKNYDIIKNFFIKAVPQNANIEGEEPKDYFEKMAKDIKKDNINRKKIQPLIDVLKDLETDEKFKDVTKSLHDKIKELYPQEWEKESEEVSKERWYEDLTKSLAAALANAPAGGEGEAIKKALGVVIKKHGIKPGEAEVVQQAASEVVEKEGGGKEAQEFVDQIGEEGAESDEQDEDLQDVYEGFKTELLRNSRMAINRQKNGGRYAQFITALAPNDQANKVLTGYVNFFLENEGYFGPNGEGHGDLVKTLKERIETFLGKITNNLIGRAKNNPENIENYIKSYNRRFGEDSMITQTEQIFSFLEALAGKFYLQYVGKKGAVLSKKEHDQLRAVALGYVYKLRKELVDLKNSKEEAEKKPIKNDAQDVPVKLSNLDSNTPASAPELSDEEIDEYPYSTFGESKIRISKRKVNQILSEEVKKLFNL